MNDFHITVFLDTCLTVTSLLMKPASWNDISKAKTCPTNGSRYIQLYTVSYTVNQGYSDNKLNVQYERERWQSFQNYDYFQCTFDFCRSSWPCENTICCANLLTVMFAWLGYSSKIFRNNYPSGNNRQRFFIVPPPMLNSVLRTLMCLVSLYSMYETRLSQNVYSFSYLTLTLERLYVLSLLTSRRCLLFFSKRS